MSAASDAARALANCRPLRAVVCSECGKTFKARDKRAKTCSNKCRQAAKYRRVKEARRGKKD
jgi:hypothetical protein